MKIIGIDPGLQGGIAILETATYPKFKVETHSLEEAKPTYPVMALERLTLHTMPLIGDKDYDVQAIKNIFREHRDVALVCVERQQSMPGQGLSSTFKTGQGFGILIGVLSALELRYEVVPAQRWQRQLFTGLKHGQDTKISSEIVAKRLFPTTDFRRSSRARVASDGLTDACCIAEFARRTMGTASTNREAKPHTPNPVNEEICLKCGAFIPIADEDCYK